jgi:beta-lactamase regulating signal transducer with metallopeptidase domain
MWAIALGVIPAAAVVSGLCALCVRRPATRHALWLVVLLLFVTPLTAMLPGAPRLPDPVDALAAARSALTSGDPASTPADPPKSPSPALSNPARDLSVAETRAPAQKIVAAPTLLPAPSFARTIPAQPADSKPIAQLRSPNRAAAQPSPAPIFRVPLPQSSASNPSRPSLDIRSPSAGLSEKSAARPTITPRVLRALPPKVAEPAPAPAPIVQSQTTSEPAAKPAPALPAQKEEPQVQRASPTEVDRYIDRLIGARDAVAAVPPPPSELWLSGVLAILCVTVLRAAWRRRGCHDVFPADTETRLLIAACASRIELRRPPEAFFTPRRVSPLVTCGARPRIILPAELWERLDDRARQAVILHELAHLRRGDHWIRWIEQAITLAYWWHPVIWCVRNRLRHEADLCCDAWVTSLLPSARRAYAEALISTRAFLSERTDPSPAPGLAMTSARAKRFARRLTMVMTDSARPRTSPLGIALALAVATAGTFVVPTLACPDEKSQASKASAPQVIVIPSPEASPEPTVALGVRSAPRAPAAPRAPKPPKAPKAHSHEAPPAPGEPSESTFEQYMRSGSTAEVLRRLEERLARLERGVAELHSHGGIARVGPMPAMPRAITPGPGHNWAPRAEGVITIAPSDDGQIKRLYVLPEGKLEDLTALMARSDVPVLINRGDEAITVYGTPAQHETFYQFLILINPDGVRVISSDEGADGEEASAPRHKGSMKRSSKEGKDAARKLSAETRAAVEAQRAQMALLRDHMREMQVKRRGIESEAREMERKAEQMREQAEQLREEAERAREERSEKADSIESVEVIARIESQANEIEAQADAIEAEFAAREHEVESIEMAVDELESQIDEMVEQIEEMIESAQDFEEDAESDREV